MYRVLLVDDHAYLVETLSIMIPWTELNVETVHKAYSADEALEKIRSDAVDIVITDIRMPGMSGLELTSNIRHRWKNIKCIILSGYNDFKYVKEAMHTQTVDYLLKPVEEEELICAVKKAIACIEEERAELKSRQRALSLAREQMPVLRSELLNELLLGRRMPEYVLSEKLNTYEVPLAPGDPFVMLLVRMENVYFGQDYNSLSLFEFAIGNIAGEVFRGDPLWQSKDSYDHLVFVMKCGGKDDLQRIELASEQLQRDVRHYLQGTISYLIGEPGRFPQDFAERYQTAFAALRKYIHHDEEIPVQIAKMRHTVPIQTIRCLNQPPALHHLFEVGRWEEIRDKLEQAFQELSVIQPEALHEHLMELYFVIASSLIGTAHKYRLPFGEILGIGTDRWMAGGSFRSLNEFKEWTFWMVDLFRTKTLSLKDDSRAILVKQVQEYIEQHLDQNVSLQAIADHVYLNPTYLSSVYKLQTGQSLSEYMYRLRMEKASYYLQNSTDRVYEISSKLGFQNTNYFIKLFKRYFDLTPQEYREKLRVKASAGAR